MITTLTFITIPLLAILFSLEVLHSYQEEKHLYKRRDTVSNLAVGVGYFVCNILSKGSLLFIFQLASKISLFHLRERWYTWVLGLLESRSFLLLVSSCLP